MSSLQDTPQQALAGWLHQRGGEKAIKKMAEDLGVERLLIEIFIDHGAEVEVHDFRAVDIAIYTDGEVIFPECPEWIANKIKQANRAALDALEDEIKQLHAQNFSLQFHLEQFEGSWLFKLWRFFHG